MKTGAKIRFLAFLALVMAGGLLLFPACTASKKSTASTTLDLDSLNRELEHQDSVESNVYFYRDSYQDYQKRFPSVMKSDYMRIAKGKDQDFCLFKPNPAATCLENGDKFNDVDLKGSARDCYHAGLLSEAHNDSTQNIKLWASMGQLAIEDKDYEAGKAYLGKLLAADPKNKWAKKLLASLPRN